MASPSVVPSFSPFGDSHFLWHPRTGADPNSVDSLNQTALHFTAAAPQDKSQNVPEIIAALVEHKVDVAVKDTEGAPFTLPRTPQAASAPTFPCPAAPPVPRIRRRPGALAARAACAFSTQLLAPLSHRRLEPLLPHPSPVRRPNAPFLPAAAPSACREHPPSSIRDEGRRCVPRSPREMRRPDRRAHSPSRPLTASPHRAHCLCPRLFALRFYACHRALTPRSLASFPPRSAAAAAATPAAAHLQPADKWKRTPLLVAAARSHFEASRALLLLGADANAQCGAWAFNGFKARTRRSSSICRTTATAPIPYGWRAGVQRRRRAGVCCMLAARSASFSPRAAPP